MPSKPILPHLSRTFPILAFLLQVLDWFAAIWCTIITTWLAFFFDKTVYLAYHVSVSDFKVQVSFNIFNMFSTWVTFVVFNYLNMFQHLTKSIETDIKGNLFSYLSIGWLSSFLIFNVKTDSELENIRIFLFLEIMLFASVPRIGSNCKNGGWAVFLIVCINFIEFFLNV